MKELAAMPIIYIKMILFFSSLLFVGLFAFLETAFTAIRLFKIKELAKQIGKYHRLFEAWEKNPQRILISILIAANLAHVICSVAITDVMQVMLGDTGMALAIGVTTATIMILVFGEIIPKSFAKNHHEFLVGSTLWLINFLFYLFYPLTTLLLKIANGLVRRVGGPSLDVPDVISEKEIEFLIGYSTTNSVMERAKIQMLQNVFSLGQTLCKEIMVPATDMIMIDVNATMKEALELFSRYHFTRIPVYEGKEDDIIGLIHQKDVFDMLNKGQEKPLREIVLPILYVPETKRINQLLVELQEKRSHMAILIDEYGAVMGMVTLEDIIEEIVGEISDEHERVHVYVMPLEEGGWLMDARVEIEDVQEVLGIYLEVKDSVTLGGFLAERLQHLPKKGDRVSYDGYCFQIQRASSRRVYQVLVFKEYQQVNFPDDE